MRSAGGCGGGGVGRACGDGAGTPCAWGEGGGSTGLGVAKAVTAGGAGSGSGGGTACSSDGCAGCVGGSGVGCSDIWGTCVAFSAMSGAGGRIPKGEGGTTVGGACFGGGGGGGSGGFGCSKLTRIGSSGRGTLGRWTDIHHNASPTRTCNKTASAGAAGNMRSEREAETLTSWATRVTF